MPYLFLVWAGLVAGYAVVFAASPVAQTRGEGRNQELICLLLAGVLGLAYWVWRRGSGAPRLGAGLDWMILLPPGYALFQATPLPLAVVRMLSPGRARLVDALIPVVTPPQWVPLSVTPAATTLHCLLFATCLVFFLVIYDLAWRVAGRPWALVAPLVALAAAEAGLGVSQMAATPNGIATGTYSIRNHYAGLLEMVLPFAVLYAFAALRRARKRDGVQPHLQAFLGCAAAALILAGILLSLSRMGFAATLGSMMFIALMALLREGAWPRNALVLGGVVTLALAAFILLPTFQFIERFNDIDQEDEARSVVWRASLPLIAEYPLVGCGLGGYESAFTAFKTSAVTLIQDYAHNDYVQYAAELGLLGFVIFGVPIAIVLSRLRRAWRKWPHDARWLALACTGSAVALGLHSIADFNLYVPANMFVFAWVLGVAAYAGHERVRGEVLPRENGGVSAGLEPRTHPLFTRMPRSAPTR